MSNFYTATVYNKGAEVIRMMRTLLGPENFRKGADLYFDRHDGQAVTCEDFVRAMEEASGRSVEHTSELQSLMRISYAVFCLKKKILITIYDTSLKWYKNTNDVESMRSNRLLA